MTAENSGEATGIAGAQGFAEGSLGALLESLHNGIVVQDADGTVVASNRAAHRILGLSADELSGRTPTDTRWRAVLDDGLPYSEFSALSAESVARGVTDRDELVAVHKPDGSLTWALMSSAVVASPGGAQVVTSFTDVSGVKAVEHEYRLLAENADDVIFRLDTNGVIEWVSPNVTALLGWLPSDWVGHDRAEFTHPNDLPDTDIDDSRGQVRPTGRYGGRVRLRSKTGVYRWLDLSLTDIRDAAGRVVGAVGSARDVDDAVQLETALVDAASQLGAVLDNTADVVGRLGADGTLLWVSPSIRTVFGWEPEEIIGTPFRISAPSWRDHMQQALHRAVEQHADHYAERLQVLCANGQTRWADANNTLVWKATGELDSIVVVMRDVSREVALQQVAQRMLENATDVVFEADLDNVYRWVSPSVTAVLGWEPDEIIGKTAADFVPPVDLAAIVAARNNPNASGVASVDEFRFRRADGEYHWVSGVSRVVSDDTGAFQSRVIGLRDIQSLIEAKQQAEAASERFRSLVEALPDPTVVFTPIYDHARVVDLRFTFLNEAARRTYGQGREDLSGHTLLEMFPSTRDSGMFDFYVQALQSPGQSHQRVRDVNETGVTASFDISASPFDNDLVVVYRDITDMLAREHGRIATMQSMLDPHVLLRAVRDSEGRISDFVYLDANTAACEYMQMTPEQLIGSRLLDLLPGQAGSGMLRLYAAAVESGVPLILNDYAYPHEILQDERRYDIRAIKIGDGLSFTWRDITDRHNAAVALAKSEERYRLLAENATDVVYQIDGQGRIAWSSERVADVLGWTASEIVGRPALDLIYPGDRVKAGDQLRRAGHEGIDGFRVRMSTKEGSARWVEISAHPIEVEGETMVSGGWRDIQSEVTAQRAVIVEKERLRATMDAQIDPHVMLETLRDASGQIEDFVCTDANDAACADADMTRQEVIGSHLLELIPGQLGVDLLARFAEVIQSGDPLVLDDYRAQSDLVGQVRYLDLRAVRVRAGLSYTWRDVTERHDSASRLEAAETRFRLMAENASDVVAQSAPDGTIQWISASVTRLLGWRPEDVVGREVLQFIHPEDVPAVVAAQSHLAQGESLTFEARVRQVDGDYRWIASHVRPIVDDSGKVTARVAGWRDVHEQHLAADALADSEALFRAAMDNSAVGMCLVAPQGRFLRVNAALCQMLGRPAEVLMVSTWQELTHPDDLDGDQELVNHVLAGSLDSYRLLKRFLLPDGDIVWGDLSVACVRNPDGTVRNFISQILDVTDMQLALADIEDAELRFRLMASNASDVVFTAGPDRAITWVSPNITDTLGWAPNDWVGRAAVEFVHPDDAREVATKLQALYSQQPGPRTQDFRLRWRSRSGPWVWMLGMATRVLSEEGRLDYVVAGLRNISDEVAARQYLASVLDSALDPHIMFAPVHDVAGRIVDLEYVDLNPAACQYRHTTRDDIVGKRLLEVYGGEASQTLLRWCVEALESGAPVIVDDATMVSEITRNSLWFDVRAVPVNGQVSITFRDVTARHNASQEVAESEEKFRLLAENATDAVLHARDGIMVWVSPSLTDILGWAPGDWVGHRFEEFTHPEDIELAQHRRAEINAGNTRVTRLRLRDIAGDFHWVEIHASPFKDREGRTDGIAASFRTIDAQVHAEKVLRDRARYDDLTGLLNRAEVFEKLRTLLTQQPRKGHETAVLFCDLDAFKEINDTFGHAMGDHVLKALAEDIRGTLRDDDTIARVGGDELLLILSGVPNITAAVRVAEKIRRKAAETHHYLDHAYTAKMSIGVTLLRSGEDPDDVIARADRAMYAAKQAGGNQTIAN